MVVVLLHLARKQYRLPLESEHVGQSRRERERERERGRKNVVVASHRDEARTNIESINCKCDC